jgi:hypothetical protein
MSAPAPTARRRRRLWWVAAAALVVIVAAVVVGLLLSNNHHDRTPPAFVAGPGKVRVVPQSSHGAAPPQVVTVDGNRVGVSLGGLSNDHGKATAGMSVIAYSESGEPSRPYAVYSVGDTITLGRITIKVLDVYVEPNAAHDAVDLQISRG